MRPTLGEPILPPIDQLIVEALIGLVAGLLGGLLGVGGSILIIPLMILYLDYAGSYSGDRQHLLQATAMIVNVFVAAPALVAHWRAGAIVRPVVRRLIPAALAGMVAGVALSNASAFARDNGVYLAMLLAGFMAYVVVHNTAEFFRAAGGAKPRDLPPTTSAWAVAAIGFPTGFAAGLLGIGGGALAVPLQQLALKMPLRHAIANSAAMIVVASSVGAIYKNATLGGHDVALGQSLQLALLMVPTAILGSYIGGYLTHRLPRWALRLAFVLFMGAMAVLTFTKAWENLPGRAATEPEAAKFRDASPAASHVTKRFGFPVVDFEQ